MTVKKYEIMEFIESGLINVNYSELVNIDIQKEDNSTMIVDYQEIEDGRIVSNKYEIKVERCE